MKHAFIALAVILTANFTLAADKIPAHPQIVVVTTEGTFKMELVTREAPHTVKHILELVDAGFYDGLIFHRVISDFMIQAGGYTPGFKLREGEETIVNESGNGMTNVRGTVAMARTGDPHSARLAVFHQSRRQFAPGSNKRSRQGPLGLHGLRPCV